MTPGIQSRGRGRITTNKINQQKTQNNVVVSQSGQSNIKYQPRPVSGQLDQSTQNKIQSTASNIEQAVRAKKVKHMVKPRTSDNPASKIMLGMSNTVHIVVYLLILYYLIVLPLPIYLSFYFLLNKD